MTTTVTEFRLPDVGEGLTEAEIVTWHVSVGDAVAINDVLVEVETAKSVVELPSPVAGIVTEIHVAVGETVPVGAVLVSVGDTSREAAAPLVLVGTGPSAPQERRRRLAPPGAATSNRQDAIERPSLRRLPERPATSQPVDITATIDFCARIALARRWTEPVTPALVLTRAATIGADQHSFPAIPTLTLGAAQEQALVVAGRVVTRFVAEVYFVEDAGLDAVCFTAFLADVVSILKDPTEAMLHA